MLNVQCRSFPQSRSCWHPPSLPAASAPQVHQLCLYLYSNRSLCCTINYAMVLFFTDVTERHLSYMSPESNLSGELWGQRGKKSLASRAPKRASSKAKLSGSFVFCEIIISESFLSHIHTEKKKKQNRTSSSLSAEHQ